VRAEPDVVSPNVLEAEELVGHEFNDDEDRTYAVKEICELGARESLMTMNDGCFARMHSKEGEPTLYRVRLRGGAIEPRATVGSGDAFLAGFVAARYQHKPVEEALAYGVACGAESTQHLGRRPDRSRPGRRLLGEIEVASAAEISAGGQVPNERVPWLAPYRPHPPRIPPWRSRSAEARRRAAPTDSMTSRSSRRAHARPR
jgi:1-phosphofructokinase/tagatose 6-phosphate kinase